MLVVPVRGSITPGGQWVSLRLGNIALGPPGPGAEAGAGLCPHTLGRGQMCRRRHPVPTLGIGAVICSTQDLCLL